MDRETEFEIVSAELHPAAHKAWAQFRREVLGATFVPSRFTVPTLFPPQSDHGINAYVALVKQWRKENAEESMRKGRRP